MRVLIVHRYFWPENVAVLPLMLRDIVELHLARGHEVRVVTGASADFSAEHEAAFGGRCRVVSFRAGRDREGGALRRVWLSARLLALGLRHLGARRWDIVYTVSYPPLMAGALGAWGRLFGRARHLIYYFQDNLVYRVPGRMLKRGFVWAQRRTIRRASRVVTLSADMAEELVSWFPDAERLAIAAKMRVIQNYAAGSTPATGRQAAPVRDIIYAGNHGAAQNLGLFLEMLAALDPVPRTAFFGDGSARAGLTEQARRLGLDDGLTFHEPVGREEIGAEIARSRFGLVGARPDLMRYAFPSKLLAYAAIGIPSLVMCPERSGTASWLRAEGFGHPIDPVSAAEGARQLRAILSKPSQDGEQAERRTRAARAFGQARFRAEFTALLDELK